MDSPSSSLRDQYISSRFSVAGDDWPPYQPKHYTTLALIHYKEQYTDKASISFSKEQANIGHLVSKQQEFECSSTDNWKTTQHSSTIKNISELFLLSTTDEHSAKVFLIEGAPGIGKTILCKEIAYQWASNNLLQHKKLLFLVYLRNVDSSKLKSLEKFVQHVLQRKAAAATLAEYLAENSGKDLVVVLDGYDELSEKDRKKSFIANLIKREVLSKCLLVITSRPSASLPLRDITDCRIEVVGFTEENRLEYIKSALPDSPEKVTALQDYLQSNPTINALCYIPLNMTILLCLSKNGISRLPKTLTEMYRKFIEMIIIRFLEKTCDSIPDAAVFNLEALPYPHDVVFKELSRFSFEALKVDKLVFKLDEIQEMCPSLTAVPSNWNGLGLLNSFTYVEDGCKIVTYHFLHFSIQEYMAAYHISTLPEKIQIKLLKDTFWLVDYYNAWIMYVGITGGETFPLIHFLSGNFFQIFTWLFKTGISKKYLQDKIKSLHIFQCLAEAQSSQLLSSISNMFQNQEIDLGDQTLLPRDLNTLGFFLLRSINKHWKRLNLSGCNMGSAGLKVLFERFVDKDTHSVVTINRVDLSHNQITFSSLVGLLKLIKAWKTIEFISVDNLVSDNETACDIFEAVEHVILQSSDVVMLRTLIIGSFLFAYKLNENEMFDLVANAEHIKTMYMINCRWAGIVLLRKRMLANVHIIGSRSNDELLGLISSMISHCNNPSLVIDDRSLSDKGADEIISLLPDNIFSGIILVVSRNKIQGVIKTHSLSSELSNLEMLHLIRRIRTLCSNFVPVVTSWDENLQWHGNKSDGIIETFVNVLLSYENTGELKIGLIEKDALCAQKLTYKEINKILSSHVLKSVYLKYCDVSGSKLNHIIAEYSNISSLCLYFLECHLELSNILSLNRFRLRELFVHGKDNITSDDVETILSTCHHHTSVVVVTKDTLGACNPTSKQMAMAHKLEPSVTSWKLFHCNLNTETHKQIAILLASTKFLKELKFVGCNIGCSEIEILRNHLYTEGHTMEIKNLSISSSRLASSDTCALSEVIKISTFTIVDDCKYPFCNSVIKILPNPTLSELCIRLNKTNGEIEDDLTAIVFNSMRLRRLDLVKSNIGTAGMVKIAKALQNISSLYELRISSNSIGEEAAIDIGAAILNNSKLKILDISGNEFQTVGMMKIIHSLRNISSLSELHINDSNIAEEAAYDIAAVILNNNKLQRLHLGGNMLEATGMIKIAEALKKISALHELRINNNNITEEAADDIAAVILSNRNLQVLDLGGNRFQTAGIIKIANSLQQMSCLSELYLSNNGITETAADSISAVILTNLRLQRLDLGGNAIEARGMTTIAEGLKKLSFLNELRINNNNVTDEAANDIARVILSNHRLQILDISGNKFQMAGIIEISNSLRHCFLLSELYLSNSSISGEAANNIASIVLKNHKLRILDISGNKFFQTAGVISIITGALRNIFYLSELYLNNCNITEKVTDEIVTIILNNIQLQKLNLGKNTLKVSGVIKIARALQNISSLSELNIAWNNSTEEAADDIATSLLNNSALQILDLSGSMLKANGMIKIANVLKNFCFLCELNIGWNYITEEAADDIAAVILNNKLQILDLGGNELKATGMIKVAKALQSISSLYKLNIECNKISDEAADDIVAVILNNSKLQKLDISSNAFHTIGIWKIANSLCNSSSISELYMAGNNIAEGAVDEVTFILSSNNKLQILEVT